MTHPDTEADLVVGFSGAEHFACVAVCAPDGVLGVCEQERVTRVRGAGFNRSGLPDEALDELLRRAGRSRQDVALYVTSKEALSRPGRFPALDHHLSHACAAFLPSPFASAAIVVCDNEDPAVSVWRGDGTAVTRVETPWQGLGFAGFYSQCAAALGLGTVASERRMEALARYAVPSVDERAAALVSLDDHRLRLAPGWPLQIERWVRSATPEIKAPVAAALQRRLGDLVVEFLAGIRRRTRGTDRLCVGGSLFHNSYINSRVKLEAGFDEVFVPVNPGNAGLALGAALHASRRPRQDVSPFLGPAYGSEEIKAILDNCKLTYTCMSTQETVEAAVGALRKGRLVAWFDGAMEWGPRALGARSIVANPFAPYVLENLNRFLKLRDPWRGYALSGRVSAVRECFDGPGESSFMECDFTVKDRDRFRHVLPGPGPSVRVQTVDGRRSPRFAELLDAFGDACGLPILVNTSFNGFQEPIVCSPRDAIRVFFGTGVDMLILGQFVLSK